MVGFVLVLCASAASGQTYRYKVKTTIEMHGKTRISNGTMVVKKGRPTRRGYMTYYGHRQFGKVRQAASVLGIRTSEGLRFYGAYSSQQPFWLYVIRKAGRRWTVTRMDGHGKIEEAVRVAPQFDATESRTPSRGVLIADVDFRINGRVVRGSLNVGAPTQVGLSMGGTGLQAHGCGQAKTIVVVLASHNAARLYCYTLDGHNLRGSQPADHREVIDGRKTNETLTYVR